MDMVGHDDPRQHTVAFAVEVQQRVLHDLGDAGVSQPARAVALVGVAFDSLAQLRGAGVVGVFRAAELQLGSPGGHDIGGDRVGQAEGDELDGAGLVEMGEIAAAVPRLGRGSWWLGHVAPLGALRAAGPPYQAIATPCAPGKPHHSHDHALGGGVGGSGVSLLSALCGPSARCGQDARAPRNIAPRGGRAPRGGASGTSLPGPARKPLLLDGARQVGKTHVIDRIFGPREFHRVHRLDFRREPALAGLFADSLSPRTILSNIELRLDTSVDVERYEPRRAIKLVGGPGGEGEGRVSTWPLYYAQYLRDL